MTRTIIKWTYRCLGWIVLGGLALALLVAGVVDRYEGYGTLAVRLTWNHEPYLPPQPVLTGAELRVRDRPQPLSPDRLLRLRPGPAKVELRLKGFSDVTSAATVRKDVATVLEVALRPQPMTITLRNSVTNATINGTPCGTKWVFSNAEIAHTYTFEASAPGYETNLLNLRIERPGQDLVTDLILHPLMGGIAIHLTPSEGTQLFLNGLPRAPSDQAQVRIGVYSVSATNPNFYPFTDTIEVTAHRTNLVEIVLRPKPASVLVETTPAVDFQVHDPAGNRLPITDHTAHAPPGQQTLTLTAKGFVPVPREFQLEPNQAYSWNVRLEREGAADLEKMKETFQRLASAPGIAPQLDKLGGKDWTACKAVEFDTEDLVHGARQYREACATISAIIQTFPDRGRAWTNEVRSANAIDYWLLMGELGKATNELAQYTTRFGPQSDFARWFGSTAGKIQDWQDKVEHNRRYLPAEPTRKTKR